MKKRPEEFRSIESMIAITGEDRETELIETRIIGNRRYLLYTDKHGDGWYRTQILTAKGWKDEEEAIFGKKRRGR